MMARMERAALVGVASTFVLAGSIARAQEPPADAPAAPPATQGAPAQVAPSAPLVPERPLMTQPMTPPLVRRVDASEPRKITGIVLTAIGAFHGLAGTVVIGTFGGLGGGGLGLGYGLVFGGPFVGEGLVLTCIGVPLWVSGAKTVEKIDPPFLAPERAEGDRDRWVPSVEMGAGTATATWHF